MCLLNVNLASALSKELSPVKIESALFSAEYHLVASYSWGLKQNLVNMLVCYICELIAFKVDPCVAAFTG